jgi:hypothetical protein
VYLRELAISSSSKPPIIGGVIEATTTVIKVVPKLSQIHELASMARFLNDLIWPGEARTEVEETYVDISGCDDLYQSLGGSYD